MVVTAHGAYGFVKKNQDFIAICCTNGENPPLFSKKATSLDSTVVMENPGHLLDWPESCGAIGFGKGIFAA